MPCIDGESCIFSTFRLLLIIIIVMILIIMNMLIVIIFDCINR